MHNGIKNNLVAIKFWKKTLAYDKSKTTYFKRNINEVEIYKSNIGRN